MRRNAWQRAWFVGRVDVLAFCCPRWLFVDKVFKADQTGLGEIGATASNVGWKRLKPES